MGSRFSIRLQVAALIFAVVAVLIFAGVLTVTIIDRVAVEGAVVATGASEPVALLAERLWALRDATLFADLVAIAVVLVLAISGLWLIGRGIEVRLGADPVDLAILSRHVLDGDFDLPDAVMAGKGVAGDLAQLAVILKETARQANAIAGGDYRAEIAPRSEKDVLGTALREMTRTLREASRIAEQVASGNLDVRVEEKGAQDLLAQSVNRMILTLRDVAAQADQIASGDFRADVAPRSDRDQLGTALREMTKTLREATTVAEKIADGDLDIEVDVKGPQDLLARSINRMAARLKEVARQADRVAGGDFEADIVPRSDRDVLGIALVEMTQALRKAQSETRERDWLKSGMAQLNEAIQGNPGLETLASQAISCLAGWLDAKVGAFYVATPDGALTLEASYAYSRRKGLSNKFLPGEGLVGQAALEKQQIIIRSVPDDYIAVVSGLGEHSPRFICVTPLCHEGVVKGVIEIATFEEMPPSHLAYLSQAASLLAIALEGAQSRSRLTDALSQSQQLTEELQTQQEELRVTNEELREQTDRLRESQDRLKAQQEELQVSNEELEEKNELLERQKREVEAARKDLTVKAEELASASRYKSEFLANMSHELRTPLNSLLLLAQGLMRNREGNLTPDQQESVRTIYGSGSDLLRLINEILDLSKIEAGRMDLSLAPVSLAEIADGLRASFDHMARDKGLSLEVLLDGGVPGQIVTDRKRLEQILRNLLSNALKFTETGGITVTFGQTRPDRAGAPDGGTLFIAVTDTGIGIAPDKHKLIFEAFQQADGTTTRKYGGTGLGLTISRELATLLGGEISLDSSPGKGATFTLSLPLRHRAAPEPSGTSSLGQKEARAPREPDGPPPALSPAPYIDDDRAHLTPEDKIILVIEDDPRFAAILVAKCRERGCKCVAAATGEAGLELAALHSPMAVILDRRLPGMDGMAVLSALKTSTATRHIPVHVISVDDRATDSLRRGAVGHAVKPLDQDQLDAVFRKLESVSGHEIRRVLIVEDDPLVRRDTVQLIDGPDTEVTEAATAAEALEALRHNRYDCVVLDLTLPDMPGDEMLKILEKEGLSLPPVVVHTARELSSSQEEDLREHAESIVVKDVRSPERLLDEVSLFLHRVVSQMPERQKRIIHQLYDTDAALNGRKILVVDDDMRTTFALSQLLGDHGMVPVKAENGQRALDLLKENADVALVLMDVMMPVMDGYEAMRRIRADDLKRKLPIIALTAKAMSDDRDKCLTAGANDYLTKPIDAQRLLSVMRVWLSA
ncbi:MAG: response regulator [Telmatospirillum sp.]|nr:response regulator [Telmatospirillum sp.]